MPIQGHNVDQRSAAISAHHDLIELDEPGRVRRADDAAVESFVLLLQKNVLDCTLNAPPAAAHRDPDWIERTYRRHQRQAALGRLNPME